MNKAAITIKDVAREARVSVATVSRALNGHENVAEPVRKLVLEVAARLRYTPHAAARSLSSGAPTPSVWCCRTCTVNSSPS